MDTPGIISDYIGKINSATGSVVSACLIVAPILFMLRLGWTLFMGIAFGQNGQWDMRDIAIAILKVIFITVYISVMSNITMGLQDFCNLVSGSGYMDKLAAAKFDKLMADDPAWYDYIASFFNFFIEFFKSTGIAIVRILLSYVQLILGGFLYVIGPIALTVSIIAGDGMLKRWFASFITVNFWTLTMNLLDVIQDAIGYDNLSASIIFSLGFVIMYMMVPRLTTLYIGSSGATSIPSKLLGAATSIVALNKFSQMSKNKEQAGKGADASKGAGGASPAAAMQGAGAGGGAGSSGAAAGAAGGPAGMALGAMFKAASAGVKKFSNTIKTQEEQ